VKSNGFELSGLLAAEFKEVSLNLLFAVDLGIGVKYVADQAASIRPPVACCC
jgi:hypothetical protein